MCLDKALLDLSQTSRKDAEERLQQLARFSALTLQAVQNFHVESRLARPCWALLLQSLSDSNDRDSACAAVRGALRAYVLRGPEVSSHVGKRLGRAVTLERFCDKLVELGHYAGPQSARIAVKSILNKPLAFLKKNWGHVPLGCNLMWSTFNPEDDSMHPFEGMGGSADEIRGLLGLDPNEAGLPLLLFEYKLPEDKTARFPTVAEAYGGTAWPYFFRPAPKGSPYGMTMPWPEFANRVPRPEVVHEVIEMEHLIGRIREINEPTTH